MKFSQEQSREVTKILIEILDLNQRCGAELQASFREESALHEETGAFEARKQEVRAATHDVYKKLLKARGVEQSHLPQDSPSGIQLNNQLSLLCSACVLSKRKRIAQLTTEQAERVQNAVIGASERINQALAELTNDLNQKYGLEAPWEIFGLDRKAKFEAMLQISQEPAK